MSIFLYNMGVGGENVIVSQKELKAVYQAPTELKAVYVAPVQLKAVYVEPIKLKGIWQQ